MKIETGRRVRLKVRLQVVDGDVLEQSVVEYFHGAGKMLAGLEKAVEGLASGDKKEGVIPAREAFGNPAGQPRKTLARAEFPADAVLKKGQEFQAKAEKGQDVLLLIEDVRDQKVDVRLVHPLASKDIAYEVEVISVTDPTPPPLPASAVAMAEEAEEESPG
ncbi:MAG TPA: FKBP-type peptidyl-prolyl cis-trans isomerase [Candidatus Acidoferrum sp.]|nr:FKBP-type peptidyl-prolyl cis-trans isomerase [Candidatus Acidoferrum sp.]